MTEDTERRKHPKSLPACFFSQLPSPQVTSWLPGTAKLGALGSCGDLTRGGLRGPEVDGKAWPWSALGLGCGRRGAARSSLCPDTALTGLEEPTWRGSRRPPRVLRSPPWTFWRGLQPTACPPVQSSYFQGNELLLRGSLSPRPPS